MRKFFFSTRKGIKIAWITVGRFNICLLFQSDRNECLTQDRHITHITELHYGFPEHRSTGFLLLAQKKFTFETLKTKILPRAKRVTLKIKIIYWRSFPENKLKQTGRKANYEWAKRRSAKAHLSTPNSRLSLTGAGTSFMYPSRHLARHAVNTQEQSRIIGNKHELTKQHEPTRQQYQTLTNTRP